MAGLPEIESLVEYFAEIISVFVNFMRLPDFNFFPGDLPPCPFFNRRGNRLTPMFQLFRRQKIFNYNKSICLIILNLVVG
jgi:hypothetical protein